ncbi:MAG: hypothetical protein WC821_01990 [archaeon]|jgi:hypothetical protein
MGKPTSLMHPEVPLNMDKLKKKLQGMKAFDFKVKRKPETRALANAIWKKRVADIKPGAHPVDKVLIKLAKEARGKVNSLNELAVFCDNKIKEAKAPFSRALIDMRLRMLVQNKLIDEVRKTINKKPKKAVVNTTLIKDSPFFKIWKLQGNHAMVLEYQKQRALGNTSAMKEIERVMIAGNPNKPAERVMAMLSK